MANGRALPFGFALAAALSGLATHGCKPRHFNSGVKNQGDAACQGGNGTTAAPNSPEAAVDEFLKSEEVVEALACPAPAASTDPSARAFLARTSGGNYFLGKRIWYTQTRAEEGARVYLGLLVPTRLDGRAPEIAQQSMNLSTQGNAAQTWSRRGVRAIPVEFTFAVDATADGGPARLVVRKVFDANVPTSDGLEKMPFPCQVVVFPDAKPCPPALADLAGPATFAKSAMFVRGEIKDQSVPGGSPTTWDEMEFSHPATWKAADGRDGRPYAAQMYSPSLDAFLDAHYAANYTAPGAQAGKPQPVRFRRQRDLVLARESLAAHVGEMQRRALRRAEREKEDALIAEGRMFPRATQGVDVKTDRALDFRLLASFASTREHDETRSANQLSRVSHIRKPAAPDAPWVLSDQAMNSLHMMIKGSARLSDQGRSGDKFGFLGPWTKASATWPAVQGSTTPPPKHDVLVSRPFLYDPAGRWGKAEAGSATRYVVYLAPVPLAGDATASDDPFRGVVDVDRANATLEGRTARVLETTLALAVVTLENTSPGGVDFGPLSDLRILAFVKNADAKFALARIRVGEFAAGSHQVQVFSLQ